MTEMDREIAKEMKREKNQKVIGLKIKKLTKMWNGK